MTAPMDGADAAALARARRRAAPSRAPVPAPARPQHYRVAVLGAAEAGKTALVARWAGAPPPATYAPTLGALPSETPLFLATAAGPARVTFVDWCWDHAADADVTRQMAASDAAVAVFSLADGKSFTRAAVAAVAYGSKRPVVFVGTHSDGKVRCDADAMARRDAVLCSCATGAGVDRARARLLDALGVKDSTSSSEDAWLLCERRVDAYERYLKDDEACVLDLVKRRLGFDDGLDPEKTVAAALKLLGFAADPDAVLKDNLARAAALHGLDAEEDDEDEEPDDVFAADASVKKRAVKRVARAAGDGAAVDVVQASTDEEVTRAARRRARINERDRADAAAARAARERFLSCVPFRSPWCCRVYEPAEPTAVSTRPSRQRRREAEARAAAGAAAARRERRAARAARDRRAARGPRAAAAEALRAAERARAAALKAALAAEDAATSAEKRDYGLRKASIGAAWPTCVVHAGYETPGKGVSLRLDVPEAWRDAPLAKLLAAVDAWEMTKARKKAKRRRRPVRARSARCEDLEGYNLDHLSVYEAIEASGGCVVLR